LNHRKEMKAERSQLIPRKNTETLVLSGAICFNVKSHHDFNNRIHCFLWKYYESTLDFCVPKGENGKISLSVSQPKELCHVYNKIQFTGF